MGHINLNDFGLLFKDFQGNLYGPSQLLKKAKGAKKLNVKTIMFVEQTSAKIPYGPNGKIDVKVVCIFWDFHET